MISLPGVARFAGLWLVSFGLSVVSPLASPALAQAPDVLHAAAWSDHGVSTSTAALPVPSQTSPTAPRSTPGQPERDDPQPGVRSTARLELAPLFLGFALIGVVLLGWSRERKLSRVV